MKLTYVITGLSTGGAETMLLKLLQNINRQRFEPTVISLTTRGEIGPRIEALGITVHALGMRPGWPSPFKFMRLVGLLRKSKPNVVHTWMYHADLLGGLAARLTGIRAVAWGIRHSNLCPEQNKRSTLLVLKMCAHVSGWLPKRILSCSERAQSIHIQEGYRADKMVLIPNGFDLSRFKPDAQARKAVRAELGLGVDTPIVGLVARYDLQKNHPGFIDMAARLHSALPQVHFVLVGRGVDWNNKVLTALIAAASLTNHAHLLGQRDDIPRLMSSFDLLASSSFGEAFSNVLGEAMACGVPCVATDAGDSAWIVGETGRVVPLGDMPRMASVIKDLLKKPIDERVALGAAARERVANLFEVGAVAKQYEAFYESLVSPIPPKNTRGGDWRLL